MRLYHLLVLSSLMGLFFVAAGCDSEGMEEEDPVELEVTKVEDLPADPFTGFAEDGRPIGSGHYVFYSLRENEELVLKDSLGPDWDIAFRGTSILVNSGTSGPGEGQAQVVEGTFDEMVAHPVSGFTIDKAEGPAIPESSGSGWYNYNPDAMVVTPIPGRVLIIRTADGDSYVKLRILSYYKDAPDTPTADAEARYYTFEYAFFPE
jgi:hypothetical protein